MAKNIKFGLASINTTVGAVESNTDKIINVMGDLGGKGCDVVVFPEMCVPGYPADDLVLWPSFQEAQAEQIDRIVDASFNWPYTTFIIGTSKVTVSRVYNVATVIAGGECLSNVPKEHLPTYGVFSDGRTFEPGKPGIISFSRTIFGDCVFHSPNRFSLSTGICEDLWTPNGPVVRRLNGGCLIATILSASPFRDGVMDTRRRLLETTSANTESVIVYVNAVGGNGPLVFDGGSIIAQNGTIVYESKRYEETVDTFVLDIDTTISKRMANTTWGSAFSNHFADEKIIPKIIEIPSRPSNEDHKPNANPAVRHKPIPNDRIREMREAIVLGLGDYYHKIGAWDGVAIATSGGIDSSLALLLADDWARKEYQTNGKRPHILCVSMPTKHNSASTKSFARKLANNLIQLSEVPDSIEFLEMPIQEQYDREVEEIINSIPGYDDSTKLRPITDQNIQARIRGARMWNLSNELDLLWLQTGNMSEKAVGYCTMGGDVMGSLAIISNLSKTDVKAMIFSFIDDHLLDDDIINDIVTQVPSAELASDQSDERELMPFMVLEACYELMVGLKKTPQELYDVLCERFTENDLLSEAPWYKKGMLKEWAAVFCRRFFQNVFKWVQCPLGIHLNDLDLDYDRALRIPIVHSPEWMNIEIEGDL